MGQVDLHRTALLVTGTIVPNSSFVAHANVEQRRKEYMDGLLFYRGRLPGTDIFFLENSVHDFSSDKEFGEFLKKEKIELMKFSVSDKFSEGKGYQEFQMLDKAIEQLASRYDHFAKVTGRYKVQNIADLLPQNESKMVADSHKKHGVTQTNIFFVGTTFYQDHLSGLYKLANDSEGKFIEHVVYEQLKRKSILDQVSLFRINPVITGFSGSYGGSLNRNKYKMMLRNCERALLRVWGFHEFMIEY